MGAKAVPKRPNCATFTALFSTKWASYTFSHLHLATFGIRGGGRVSGIVNCEILRRSEAFALHSLKSGDTHISEYNGMRVCPYLVNLVTIPCPYLDVGAEAGISPGEGRCCETTSGRWSLVEVEQ